MFTIPKTQEEYEAAVADAFSYEDVIVVEEYIKGREFSVGVVDGIAYPIIEIAPIEAFMITRTNTKPEAPLRPVRPF